MGTPTRRGEGVCGGGLWGPPPPRPVPLEAMAAPRCSAASPSTWRPHCAPARPAPPFIASAGACHFRGRGGTIPPPSSLPGGTVRGGAGLKGREGRGYGGGQGHPVGTRAAAAPP